MEGLVTGCISGSAKGLKSCANDRLVKGKGGITSRGRAFVRGPNMNKSEAEEVYQLTEWIWMSETW